jgi:hypothetical protein
MSGSFSSSPASSAARLGVISALLASGALSPVGNSVLSAMAESLDLAGMNDAEFRRLGFTPDDIATISANISSMSSPSSRRVSPVVTSSSRKASPSSEPVPAFRPRPVSEIGTDISALPMLNCDEFKAWLCNQYGVPLEYVQDVTITGLAAVKVRSATPLELAGVPGDMAAVLIEDVKAYRMVQAEPLENVGKPWVLDDLPRWTSEDVKRWLAVVFKDDRTACDQLQAVVSTETAVKLSEIVKAGLDDATLRDKLMREVFPGRHCSLVRAVSLRNAIQKGNYGNRPANPVRKQPSLAMKLVGLQNGSVNGHLSFSLCGASYPLR